MIRAGDSNVHFSKVKPAQLEEIRSVLQRRPPEKFSMGLSPEAQEAMHQVAEESKIEQGVARGKRCSKGNVLFNETVQIRKELSGPGPNLNRRASCSVISENQRPDRHIGALLEEVREDYDGSALAGKYHGRRRGSLPRCSKDRIGSLGRGPNTLDEVDEVGSANRLIHQVEGKLRGEDKVLGKNYSH